MNEIYENIIPNLDIFFCGIALFVGLFLTITGVQRKSIFNLVLGSVLISFSLELGCASIEDSLGYTLLPSTFNFFSIGVLIIFNFSRYITFRKNSPVFWGVLFFLFAWLAFPFFIIETINESGLDTILLFSSIINVVLLSATLRNLISYEKELENEYSSFNKRNFNGIRFITWVMISFCGINAILYLALILLGKDFPNILMLLNLFYTYFLIVYISSYALTRQTILSEIKADIEIVKELKLSENAVSLADEKLFLEIQTAIKEEQLYLDAELNLTKLSEKFNTKSTVVSQTIKHFSGGNFYAFINFFRVEHFKQLVNEKQNSKMSIDGLILSCGSKSKSSFYSHFQKVEGCTPAQYIKSLSAD